MVGGRGNDVLDGRGGADVLRGGEGNDTLVIGDASFQRLDGGNGEDTLFVNGAMTLADTDFRRVSGMESIQLGNHTVSITLGPIAAHAFDGLAADNFRLTIDGRATLTADVTIDGSAYTHPLTIYVPNTTGSVKLTGGLGNDVLIGGAGSNTLIGGGGDDLYYANHTADAVTEAANGGYDTVVSTVSFTLPANVEALHLVGSGLTGTGTGGNDSLLSRGGPNTLVGLGGDDLYYVNNTADAVTEAANDGYDIVISTVSYTLPANVEVLYLVGSGLTGTGTGGNDSLLSSGGPNTLVGLGGDDLYYVNNTADAVTEAANGGYDTVVSTVSYTLSANVETLHLVGSGLTGTGTGGNDSLLTLGANTLTGGGGDDTFYFVSGVADGAAISDFDDVGEHDILTFSGFGTAAQGATFTQIGVTDQWQIHSGLDAHNETITLSNHATPHAGDFLFM